MLYVFTSEHSYLYKTKGKYYPKQINYNKKNRYISIQRLFISYHLFLWAVYFKYFVTNVTLERGRLFPIRRECYLLQEAEVLTNLSYLKWVQAVTYLRWVLGVPASAPCIKRGFLFEAVYRSLLPKYSETMSLSAKDKDTVKAFWATVSPKAGEIGAEALYRYMLFFCFCYFPLIPLSVLRTNSFPFRYTGCWQFTHRPRPISPTGLTWALALPKWRSTERLLWLVWMVLSAKLMTWPLGCLA